ncbi:hypothetical protein W97_03043 [Coniosporium apollinis CBS 100218]|uniref:Fe2OG dioxygenase domain-containing protein n=1 Tax=Coniosporium apollinis (strain CBS 100218) TaxID=1168221 RepID=R7YPF9_CONA1|nr:uncharacterized protein W97_03043 [Coniosporium apollinis CBS 100218]EON63815.1 hypothetical protein W97_03043 [Coniosporium apollinis CBS 100218]
MDAFVSRKRRRISPTDEEETKIACLAEEESTDFKLAVLASLHPDIDHSALLEALLASNGVVDAASEHLLRAGSNKSPSKRRNTNSITGYQSTISSFSLKSKTAEPGAYVSKKPSAKKGKTLHLYSPEDIETTTPCSIIHNFLPPNEADALLHELLKEAPTFKREKFRLFENVVESPHTMCFYVDSWDEAERQKTEYVYNGSYIADVRKTLPEMRNVAVKVQEAVNAEIQRRIQIYYPGGQKLKYQSPDEWKPNAAFVNCYDGGAESVGYHSDQLTYLGPRAVIGSLSLGVAREFRVRRVVARDEDEGESDAKNGHFPGTIASSAPTRADAEGQISIHLPHNSLLVMHAEMQEEWKHSIAPASAIDPHPLAGNKRLNITYRCYKASLHPRFTPRCKCGVPTVLRCVQRKRENRGRYMWMCHANYTPGQEGCSFFQWAEFNDDGEPPWAKGVLGAKEAEGVAGSAT